MAMPTISLQLLVLLATSTAAVISANELQLSQVPAPSPSSSAAATFLRASCAATDLLDTCYNLLLPYAESFHGSLARVARASAAVAAARQHRFAGELAHLRLRGTGAGRMADMTLADCFETVSASDTFANETLGHLGNLVAGVRSMDEFDWERSRAQEWLGSAESGMMQCVDWFHGAGKAAVSSPVGKEVIAGCTAVIPYMHVALMLTNALKF